jgi:cytochrome oxidase assembly protein ShyY1
MPQDLESISQSLHRNKAAIILALVVLAQIAFTVLGLWYIARSYGSREVED